MTRIARVGLLWTSLAMLPAAGEAQFTCTTNADNTITITGYEGSGGDVTIPSTTNGLRVVSIGDVAFYECESLTSVTIPNSVTSIGVCTFRFTGLASAKIPNSVARIGGYAYASCTSLTNVTIGSGVTNIGVLAFSGCTNLTGVYFKGNAPSLAEYVFLEDDSATIYYLLGTTGWGTNFGGRPTAPWNPQAKGSAAPGVRSD